MLQGADGEADLADILGATVAAGEVLLDRGFEVVVDPLGVMVVLSQVLGIRPSQGVFRSKVRWVTPLGAETASIS